MKLEKSSRFPQPEGPVVFVVMDGVGVGPDDEGNAVSQAHTPNLDRLKARGPYITIRAHGTAVGLPSNDDMGNSEVGHNALGAGRVFAQGAKLVNQAMESGAIFDGQTWKEAVAHCRDNAALHFVGLLSDGNVHSHINHLERMIGQASTDGVKKVFIHALLDGRDVGERSALEYIDRLEAFLEPLNKDGKTYRIASGGGRMKVTMDRYEADWSMVERGWKTHVLGEVECFLSARDAIEAFRTRDEGITDQYLPPFVVGDNKPVGCISDGDSVLFFNFRGDRAIEISQAFEYDEFDKFDRGPKPKVYYAGMMEYDGDAHIPEKYLVNPPSIDRPMSQYLASSGVHQWACSETQKFGHVTYFWNGNKSGKFDENLETYVEIPSDLLPFEERPWMKAAEITDATIQAIEDGRYSFIRINYANGDMVGHTGILDSARLAVEAVDVCIGRLVKAVEKAKGVLLVTADHGNADEMYMKDKKGLIKEDSSGRRQPKTSHTLQPVPVYLFDPVHGLQLEVRGDAGLTHLTATTLELLGLEPPEDYDPSLLKLS
ncbi:MAG: 2,3-bisphosphoglycerate-independent phosphoglycerate mutase [Myxococcales bacterium]|nr:2,3-bisphosphoglycerate-independent phosphoglycerate mutase [Myxococcales bacterium]